MKAVVYTYTAKPNVLSRHRQRAECVDAAESAGHEVIAWLHDEAGNRTNLDRLCTGFNLDPPMVMGARAGSVDE